MYCCLQVKETHCGYLCVGESYLFTCRLLVRMNRTWLAGGRVHSNINLQCKQTHTATAMYCTWIRLPDTVSLLKCR